MADLLPKPVFKNFKLETAISITKSLLLSVGFISTVTLFKVAIIPKVASLLITTLPRFWVSVSFWLSPPYVFIIFNFIIIAIAASTFRHQKETPDTSCTSTSDEDTPDTVPNGFKSVHEDQNSSTTVRSRENWHGILMEEEKNEHGDEEEEGGKPVKWDSSTLSTEKVADPSLEKFCAYSSEKVEDEDAGDSLEATWKAIMERQGKQTPQLKKSETWDSSPRLIRARADDDDNANDTVAWARNEVRKSDIFKETLSFRRKKSMSQEELKRRAEAFIEMVNKNIRLQRQESEQRFLQTVKRSV